VNSLPKSMGSTALLVSIGSLWTENCFLNKFINFDDRTPVTRQRRDCDLNMGPSASESSTLTVRLPSHSH